jgi:hypothetical protein
MIADGDLDGDLYFVCWRQNILDQIKAAPMAPTKINVDPTDVKKYNPNWLKEAQASMTDLGSGKMLSHVIGKLYNAAKEIANDNPDTFMENEDYITLSQAYKEALKIEKHGGKVHLPKRLHYRIPQKYHQMLADGEDAEDV